MKLKSDLTNDFFSFFEVIRKLSRTNRIKIMTYKNSCFYNILSKSGASLKPYILFKLMNDFH